MFLIEASWRARVDFNVVGTCLRQYQPLVVEDTVISQTGLLEIRFSQRVKSFSETFSGFTKAGEDGCDALSYDVVVDGETQNFLGLSIDTFMADSQDPWDYAFSWRCVNMEQDTL